MLLSILGLLGPHGSLLRLQLRQFVWRLVWSRKILLLYRLIEPRHSRAEQAYEIGRLEMPLSVLDNQREPEAE